MSEFKKWWCDWAGSDKLPENTDIRYGFEAGQQSQQAKIDQLNEKHSEEKRILHNVIEMDQAKIDELQGRIDELERFAKSVSNWDDHPKDLELNKGSWGVRDFYRNYSDSVLKGNKDE